MDFVEGVPVRLETFGSVTKSRSYTRIVVDCPLCQSGHVGKPRCSKRRTLGANQCSNFGDMEPYGYLGAWLHARDRFGDRTAHMAYNPTSKDVGEYMRTQQWL